MSSVSSIHHQYTPRKQQIFACEKLLQKVSDHFQKGLTELRQGTQLCQTDIDLLKYDCDVIKEFQSVMNGPNSPVPLSLASKINDLVPLVSEVEKHLESKCLKRTGVILIGAGFVLLTVTAFIGATELLRLSRF